LSQARPKSSSKKSKEAEKIKQKLRPKVKAHLQLQYEQIAKLCEPGVSSDTLETYVSDDQVILFG
jgi:hypothetical protein